MAVINKLRCRKKIQAKRSLYLSALDLFREHGYANTKIEMIALAANQSRTTFFNYFSLKEEILFKINDNALKFIARAIRTIQAESSSYREAFFRLLSIIAGELKRDKRLYAGVFQDIMLLEVSSDLKKRKRGISRICIPLATFFKEGRSCGEFEFKEKPFELSQLFFGMLFSVSLNYVYSVNQNVYSKFKTMGDLFLRGIENR